MSLACLSKRSLGKGGLHARSQQSDRELTVLGDGGLPPLLGAAGDAH
jgi:hypothetical protein